MIEMMPKKEIIKKMIYFLYKNKIKRNQKIIHLKVIRHIHRRVLVRIIAQALAHHQVLTTIQVLDLPPPQALELAHQVQVQTQVLTQVLIQVLHHQHQALLQVRALLQVQALIQVLVVTTARLRILTQNHIIHLIHLDPHHQKRKNIECFNFVYLQFFYFCSIDIPLLFLINNVILKIFKNGELFLKIMENASNNRHFS